ncbi:MAG: hypothetical protein KatS3mg091_860 [Patescibacteria group bacterium]|nr:MAG: hypothetical protein KatS3mg091_860 [Patescibacteria group bacterium]
MGKILIAVGLLLVVIGLVLSLLQHLKIFPLPGDIIIDKPNIKIYIPITTSIVISLILSLIFYILNK